MSEGQYTHTYWVVGSDIASHRSSNFSSDSSRASWYRFMLLSLCVTLLAGQECESGPGWVKIKNKNVTKKIVKQKKTVHLAMQDADCVDMTSAFIHSTAVLGSIWVIYICHIILIQRKYMYIVQYTNDCDFHTDLALRILVTLKYFALTTISMQNGWHNHDRWFIEKNKNLRHQKNLKITSKNSFIIPIFTKLKFNLHYENTMHQQQ